MIDLPTIVTISIAVCIPSDPRSTAILSDYPGIIPRNNLCLLPYESFRGFRETSSISHGINVSKVHMSTFIKVPFLGPDSSKRRVKDTQSPLLPTAKRRELCIWRELKRFDQNSDESLE